jgi:hypothetical protein
MNGDGRSLVAVLAALVTAGVLVSWSNWKDSHPSARSAVSLLSEANAQSGSAKGMRAPRSITAPDFSTPELRSAAPSEEVSLAAEAIALAGVH